MFDRKSYIKEYNQKNKEKIRKYYQKWCQENIEKRRKHQQKYRQKHPEKDKQYYKNNREKIIDKQKKYYQENKEKCKKARQKHYQENKEKYKKLSKKRQHLWKKIIEKYYGEIKCQICGYNKNFAAIEFHHKIPNEKEYALGRLFHYKPTSERIEILKEELKKGHFLCANCHREIHNPDFLYL